MSRVCIFHTSDMHNKLTSEIAEEIAKLKKSEPGSLYLDSGDALSAGNIFWRPFGEPILDLMNSIPCDAMCMGNREFHFSRTGTRSKLSKAKFPILTANLRGLEKVTDGKVEPYKIFEVNGVRVAVFGLTVPAIEIGALVSRFYGMYFADPRATAAELVPTLREQADVVVALTHTGLRKDKELVEKVGGIDLVLGGHSHSKRHRMVGDTLIAHHGYRAHWIGKVMIYFDGKSVSVSEEVIPLDEVGAR
jgi:2',3'-cyclic-nucleotide 2'-phosphodiesterase (5'-nucleotidase family)